VKPILCDVLGSESPSVCPSESPAPPMDECMPKKKKSRYNRCGNLNNKKCAAEVLCVQKTKKKCTHVCAVDTKKACQLPTLKGKAVCKFKK